MLHSVCCISHHMLVKIVTADALSLLPGHDRLLHSNVWCSVSHTKIEHITNLDQKWNTEEELETQRENIIDCL